MQSHISVPQLVEYQVVLAAPYVLAGLNPIGTTQIHPSATKLVFFSSGAASASTAIITIMVDHPQISTAQAPFDDMEADVVLRSCDCVDFYVYKAVLSLASPFFKNMFSLPQTTQASEQTVRQSAPVVDFTEGSRTLGHLLRLCYPITDPVIKKLTEVEDALEAAIKYQMDEATAIMRGMLRTHAPNEPLKVYVIACRLNLEVEAKEAAWHWRGKCPKACSKTLAPGKLPIGLAHQLGRAICQR